MHPEPHESRLSSEELASWLDRQGPESWWLVDGDSLLTGLLFFPCTGDVLATDSRRS